MDPNEALRIIRKIVRNWREDEPQDPIDALDALAEHVEALDAWLSKGGFLPSAWQPGVGEIDPDYVLDRIVPLGPPNPAHGELPDDDEPLGVFSDMATGEKAWPYWDGRGRLHLTRASGIEVGGPDGFESVEAMHEYVLTFGLVPKH